MIRGFSQVDSRFFSPSQSGTQIPSCGRLLPGTLQAQEVLLVTAYWLEEERRAVFFWVSCISPARQGLVHMAHSACGLQVTSLSLARDADGLCCPAAPPMCAAASPSTVCPSLSSPPMSIHIQNQYTWNFPKPTRSAGPQMGLRLLVPLLSCAFSAISSTFFILGTPVGIVALLF